jgi:hypothetical protein
LYLKIIIFIYIYIKIPVADLIINNVIRWVKKGLNQ